MHRICLRLAALLLLATVAQAEIGVIDDVPAATLLVPFFQVDVSPEACQTNTGATTLFSIHNALPSETLASVTLWTDWSAATFSFNVYLTGYDTQTYNLTDLFCRGIVPSTGLASGASPVGPLSDAAVGFPSCRDGDTQIETLSELALQQLQDAHTGREVTGTTGRCSGSGAAGPDLAIGYLTIDNVNECSILLGSQPGYFGEGGTGVASNVNQLWGDFFLVDPANNFSQGFNAVAIEASSDAFAPGDHTFYGRWVTLDASDGREPLPTTFLTRFALGGAFDRTRHLIWREGDAASGDVDCDSAPDWFPLGFANDTGAGSVLVFDEQENVFVPAAPSVPNEANLVEVGQAVDTGGFSFGTIYYNLQSNATLPTAADTAAQGWVLNVIQAAGRYSVGMPAFHLDTANDPVITNPGPTKVN